MRKPSLVGAVVLITMLGACTKSEPTSADYEHATVVSTSAVGYERAYGGDALIVDTAQYRTNDSTELPELHWRLGFAEVIDNPVGYCRFGLSDGRLDDIFAGKAVVQRCSYDRDNTVKFKVLQDEFTVTGRLVNSGDSYLLGPTYVVSRLDTSAKNFMFKNGFEPWESGADSSARVKNNSVGYHQAFTDQAVIVETATYSTRFQDGLPLPQETQARFVFDGEVDDPAGYCEFSWIIGEAAPGTTRNEVWPCSATKDSIFTTTFDGDTFSVGGRIEREDLKPRLPMFVVTSFDQSPSGFIWREGSEPESSPGQ